MPTSRSILRWARWLVVLCLLLAGAAIWAYVRIFGIGSSFTFARTDTAWSNFGSYVGGVLGPLFAFFAFAGVLVTVWLQARQLDVARNQAHNEELQRLIATIAGNIDTELARSPGRSVDHPHLANKPVTVFTVIAGAGTAALKMPANDYITAHSYQSIIAIAKDALEEEHTRIRLELHQLAWCMQEYEDSHGSPAVLEFYKQRYKALVCWLDAIGLLEAYTRVREYFKPENDREFLGS